MRRTVCHGAVFTPAFPNLEAFLRHHIDPDHPLRHHPLWITTNEMKNLKVDCSALRGNGEKNAPTVVMKVPFVLSCFNADQIMPENEICWQLPPADVPMSLMSRAPFSGAQKEELQQLRERFDFQSNWWGTLPCWKKNGALPKPNTYPAQLCGKSAARLLHISLVSNGQEVLKQSYVSGKSGIFQTWFNTEACQEPNEFRKILEAHVEKHSFQTPLYFSDGFLQRAGIGIRPDADPFDLSKIPLNGGEALPMSMDSPNSFESATYEQFYHISQVLFPDYYEVPLAVQEAERLHPKMPVNGVTGQRIFNKELQYDTLTRSNVPELAGIIRGDESRGFLTTDLSSPRVVEGRSVWFNPTDVLELGGMIDVNAVPVEVPIQRVKSSSRRHLYNVDQLLSPVEGYKAVGSISTLALQSSASTSNF